MATLNERPESREYGPDGSVTLLFDYRDAGTDTDAAYDALLATMPTTSQSYDGKLNLREPHPQMWPYHVDTVNGVGNYLVRCRYAPPETARMASEEVTVRVTTVGGTRHITQAYAHIADYMDPAFPGGAPDTLGILNVTKDGPEGADVIDPGAVFIITRRYTLANLPPTGTLLALRGKVNSDAVTIKDTRKNRTWAAAAGTLLCEGVDEGTVDDDGLVTVTYQMAVSPNETGLAIGDMTGIDKKGWEYLWVDYWNDVDANGYQVSWPFSVHVDQIYPTTEMNNLGLDGE